MASKGKNKGVQAPAVRFWTPTRIGMTGAIVILVALVASTLFRTTSAPPAAPSAANPARPTRPATLTALRPEAMDSDIELITGTPVKLSSYGGKVVVVDLWATWCGPCRVEIPYLKQLATEYKDKGLEVIGLTTEDKATDLEAVKAFVKQFKINYAVGWANQDIARDVMGAGRGAIPQTLVIGKDGKIKKHLIGFNMQVSAPQLRKAVEDAMAE